MLSKLCEYFTNFKLLHVIAALAFFVGLADAQTSPTTKTVSGAGVASASQLE